MCRLVLPGVCTWLGLGRETVGTVCPPTARKGILGGESGTVASSAPKCCLCSAFTHSGGRGRMVEITFGLPYHPTNGYHSRRFV